jgi:extracellular elastinolytic metalloproteinase
MLAVCVPASGQLRQDHGSHAAEARNFDARVAETQALRLGPDGLQAQAIEALRSEIPDLLVDFEATTGATYSLSNAVGFLTGPESGDVHQVALSFVRNNPELLGLSAQDLAELELTDSVFSDLSGVTHLYWRQTHQGIPVYNGQVHVNIDKHGRILSINNLALPDLAAAVADARPTLPAGQAVLAAAEHLGLPLRSLPQALSQPAGPRQTTLVSGRGVSLEDIRAELSWLPIQRGEARLVWNFQVQTLDQIHWFDFTVDAVSGKVWTRFDWTADASYRVYPRPVESPIHTSPLPPSDARQLVVDPHLAATNASPNGWHNNGTAFTIPRGNNVHAYEDRDGNNAAPASQPSGGAGLNFDFPINLNGAPSTYIPAAITNLFYWNNIIHDVQYQYGFNEQAGNFQDNNFGRGGAGNDRVRAEAQDNALGGSNCNANFSTPPDGSLPRMQMFQCNMSNPLRDGDFDNGVIVHEYGHGISIRQVGGPSNSSCLGNAQQGGEGWSDWHALVYTAKAGDTGPQARGVGSYLFNRPANGGTIRPQPYSTNQSVNNYTYSSIAGQSIPHGVGSVWAQAIWEVYWKLVDEYGFSSNLYNATGGAGNQRALQYINEGFKNTACSPTFIAARNGIIQAATTLNGGADVCRLWEAFAAFGLGTNASTPGSGSTTATNGFAVPASCSGPPPSCSVNETFSGGANGWTNAPGSTCTTGAFVAGTPTLVTNGGVTTQPAGDHTSGNGQAMFTAVNTAAGTNDVDGGVCILQSPIFSVTNASTLSLWWFHGQRDQGGDANGDFFRVEVSTNGGTTFTAIPSTVRGDVTTNAVWTNATAAIPAGSSVRIRVQASDGTASGDLIEGGIDDVQICQN